MNDLQIFKNEAFGEIRTIQQGEDILFIAADVCRALEVDRTQTRRLDDDEKGVCLIHTLGGQQNVSVINEYGLYNLVLTSRKPEAKAFKRWITHEVIPSIRKTGSYSVTQRVPKTFYEALLLAAEQQKQLEEAKPKVDFVDTYVDKGVNICLMDLGKKLGKRPRKFIELLQDEGYIMRHRSNMPYQEYINRGLFEVRTVTEKGLSQTVVTPKGVTYFAEKYRDVIV